MALDGLAAIAVRAEIDASGIDRAEAVATSASAETKNCIEKNIVAECKESWLGCSPRPPSRADNAGS